ncbi:MAG TPA: TssN family type VI secretion system protein [Flavobacteriales bacterium]|nr:DUF2231 domain-containing protein [Flavobacteriales bacterium]HNE81382.1 TssN family type VI secretion system protein [Flavobacteriales bacterium]HNK40607.1 TssN family type VI secretion system protein [Flavobacteriales bacterium]HNK69874.1 TssN family type VI secretion system protein [Flavobacteriales bacterium]HNM68388.1 TssN family type VI secretion system protein [Flavobacteriales bacterium]
MDPLGGIRSQAAQAKGVQRNVKGQLKMAKAAQSKAAKLDRKLVLHMLLFLLLGLVVGSWAFVSFFGEERGNVPKLVFGASVLGCVLLGMLHERWLVRRAEGERSLWPELLITLITMAFTGIGLWLGHHFFPILLGDPGQAVFALSMSWSAIGLLIPHLVLLAFDAASRFEPRRYLLWFYPFEHREREPIWNKDRIVIANLHFRRKEHDPEVTTVNARLPMDAPLGELVHLFIKDYNENRFPGNPIGDLGYSDGSLGWVFRTRRFLLPSKRRLPWSSRVLDPARSIADNGIDRDADIFFHRVLTTADNDE